MSKLIKVLNIIYTLGIIFFLVHQQIEVGVLFSFLSLVLTNVCYYLIKKYNRYFNIILSYSVILFIFIAEFLGAALNFYIHFPWYDDFLHFISGVLITMSGYNLFEIFKTKLSIQNANRLFIASYAFLFNLAVAGIWEIYEYLTDQLFGLNSQLNSLNDTMIDITNAFVAGILTIVIYEFFLQRKQPLKVVK